jgi:hypothetical protein
MEQSADCAVTKVKTWANTLSEKDYLSITCILPFWRVSFSILDRSLGAGGRRLPNAEGCHRHVDAPGLPAAAMSLSRLRLPRPCAAFFHPHRRTFVMLQSHIIDIDGRFVGAAVRLDCGYRFIAIDFHLEELDTSIWPTLADVRRMARLVYLRATSGGPTMPRPASPIQPAAADSR